MLYEKTREPELNPGLFKNPTSEYRGAPFWAWNCKLDKEKLVKDVSQFKEMGMGGFHIHCRVGLDTEYLGREFFDCVKACQEEGEREGLLCYLYDEDRWPSGSAGGLVTREKKYRTRFLVFSPKGYEEKAEGTYMAAAKAVRSRERYPLGTYGVLLDGEGYLEKYEKVEGDNFEAEERDNGRTETDDSQAGDRKKAWTVWEAWMEVSGDTPWFNNQAYVNTLDAEAVERFLQVTHEAYARELGEKLGENVKTIFTDEPQTTHKGVFGGPFDRDPVIIPYTDDFDAGFLQRYGYSFLDVLPELFWERRDCGNYQIRYHYHAYVLERFSEAFGDQAGRWCQVHGLALTGHMMNEWTLHSQTMAVGECMRPMKNFGIPGVDMLCDRREYSTLKQAQSVARQQGKEGVMSEIYGVTGWTFDFRNHKLAGDWQAALGVTLRVPHLTWASMEGEAKRDYPASIGRQSPWYREYRVLEDHFARLNTALTRGKAIVRVGVIHPIESYWMLWGNKTHTGLERQVMEENFSQLIEWLLFGLVDFDFISEAMLEEQGETGEKGFLMGSMEYEAVVVPECRTLRKNTAESLERFKASGGTVIFLGKTPDFVDGYPCTEMDALSRKAVTLPFNKAALLNALEPYRDVDIDVCPVDGEDPARMKHREEGKRASNLFYQLRQDGSEKWLFICHVKKPVNEHIAYTERWSIRVKGKFFPVCYDTMNGEIFPVPAAYENGRTVIEHYSSQQGSLLLKLKPVKEALNINSGGGEQENNLDKKSPNINQGREEKENNLDKKYPNINPGREEQENNLVKKGQKFVPGREDREIIAGGYVCEAWKCKHELAPRPQKASCLPQPGAYILEEDNCLLLDQAEFAFDNGPWEETEEILRIDNRFRKILGYPLRMEALAQPWLEKGEEEPCHTLKLRIRIDSAIQAEHARLAMERPEHAQIIWNGTKVMEKEEGWYVDACIKRVPLPAIEAGVNVLEVHVPFGRKTNVEWMYILGRFGVRATGRKTKIVDLPEHLTYGDITRQDLAFYGGNIRYETEVETGSGELMLEISHYRGALMRVELDGEEKGVLFLAPYRINLGLVSAGRHHIDVRVFGNRENTFGPVHNANAAETWYGPNLWRTEGNKWSYEYQLQEMGILTSPVWWLNK